VPADLHLARPAISKNRFVKCREVVGAVLDGEADAAELLGELVDRVGADP
jgi:hypothetical protein